jgi:hypothetical protein
MVQATGVVLGSIATEIGSNDRPTVDFISI